MQKRTLAARVGRNVRARRVALGLSRQDIADAIGVKKPEIGRIERGEHLPRPLEALARVLACEVRELFDAGAPRRPRGVQRIIALVEVATARDVAFPRAALRALRALVEGPKRKK